MKFYFAGYASMYNYIKDLSKPLYVLQSFVEGEKLCLLSLNLVGNENFMLDSGAFTMMQQKKKGQVNYNLNDYLEKYIYFVNKYKIKYFYNLDLERVVGIEETKKLTNKINSRCHTKCIQVFHKELGLDYFKNLVKKEDYIAIGTISDFRNHYHILKQLTKIARENECKIHGLGFTPKKVNEGVFNSVDSTSWLKTTAFGNYIFFKNNYIESIKKNNRRISLSYRDLIRHNYKEYLKYQYYLTKVGE